LAEPAPTPSPTPQSSATPSPEPTSFADGRYQVKKFLGEGGKKKVYLAHDTRLGRDIAFVLIKTEGLDDAALFLASDAASFVTRHVLIVDGGNLA